MTHHQRKSRKPTQFAGEFQLEEDEFEWDMERYVNSLASTKPVKIRASRTPQRPVDLDVSDPSQPKRPKLLDSSGKIIPMAERKHKSPKKGSDMFEFLQQPSSSNGEELDASLRLEDPSLERRRSVETMLKARNPRPFETIPKLWTSVPEAYREAISAVFENQMSSYAAAHTFNVKRNCLRRHISETLNKLKDCGIAAIYNVSDNRYEFYDCPDLVEKMRQRHVPPEVEIITEDLF